LKKSQIIMIIFLFVVLASKTVSAESNPKLYFSLGYGYLVNDTKKYTEDTSDFHIYTKFKPAISLDFKQHRLKIDYQHFYYEPTTLETWICDDLTGWDVKDFSFKYGQSILGKSKIKLSAFTGIGFLKWERKYQTSAPQRFTTNYYLTLPLELELNYALGDRIKLGIYLFSNFNNEATIMGAGVNLYHKLF